MKSERGTCPNPTQGDAHGWPVPWAEAEHPSNLIVWLVCVLSIMEQIDVEKFRVKSSLTAKAVGRQVLPRHKKGEKFIAGPVPWDWWARAAVLPGKSLHVASVIWLLALMKKSVSVQLQGALLSDLGVSRKAVYRVLKGFVEAGLITCDSGPGRRPIITLLDAPAQSNGNGKESDMTGENE